MRPWLWHLASLTPLFTVSYGALYYISNTLERVEEHLRVDSQLLFQQSAFSLVEIAHLVADLQQLSEQDDLQSLDRARRDLDLLYSRSEDVQMLARALREDVDMRPLRRLRAALDDTARTLNYPSRPSAQIWRDHQHAFIDLTPPIQVFSDLIYQRLQHQISQKALELRRLHRVIVWFSSGLITALTVIIWLLQRQITTHRRLKHATTLLHHQSTIDHLTGLHNRRSFHEHLEHALARAKHFRQPLCLAFLDLNNFKQVNDTLGHAGGDRILVAVAQILRRTLTPSALACRYGGDEFCLMLPNTELDEAVKVCRAAAEQFDRGNTEQVTFSMGIAQTGPQHYHNAQQLIWQADQQMYRAKTAGNASDHSKICWTD